MKAVKEIEQKLTEAVCIRRQLSIAREEYECLREAHTITHNISAHIAYILRDVSEVRRKLAVTLPQVYTRAKRVEQLLREAMDELERLMTELAMHKNEAEKRRNELQTQLEKLLKEAGIEGV